MDTGLDALGGSYALSSGAQLARVRELQRDIERIRVVCAEKYAEEISSQACLMQ